MPNNRKASQARENVHTRSTRAIGCSDLEPMDRELEALRKPCRFLRAKTGQPRLCKKKPSIHVLYKFLSIWSVLVCVRLCQEQQHTLKHCHSGHSGLDCCLKDPIQRPAFNTRHHGGR